MANDKMTVCKHCGAEIAASAKACPNCGGKNSKPIYKRVWFWILAIVLVIGIAGAAGGSDGDDASSTADTSANTKNEQAAEEEKIEYTDVTTDELSDALEANAMNASDTYKGNYYSVTGRLNNIDASGDYIALVDVNDEFSFLVIQCYIKNDDQLEKVKSMTIGDTITVKGKITDVGEVMGYSLDIDSID